MTNSESVEVTQADRDAARKAQADMIVGGFQGDRDVWRRVEEHFARHRLAAVEQPQQRIDLATLARVEDDDIEMLKALLDDRRKSDPALDARCRRVARMLDAVEQSQRVDEDAVERVAVDLSDELILAFDIDEDDPRLSKIIDDLRAALAAMRPAEDAWQPIGTLRPTDGMAMLVCNDRGMFVAEWEDDWSGSADERHPNLGRGWFMVSDGKDFERPLRGDVPTHWRPLPAPPAQQKDEANGE